MASTIEGEPRTVESEVARRFAQLSDDDHKTVAETIDVALDALNEVNTAAWGVSPQATAKYAEKRKAAAPAAANGR